MNMHQPGPVARALAIATLLLLVAAGCSSADAPQVASIADAEQASATATALPTTEPFALEPEAETPAVAQATTEPAPTVFAETGADAGNDVQEPTVSSIEGGDAVATFVADVWADNWFAFYVNGVLVGEDSVPITTERSFNKETITFEATYPLTIAIEAKDFKETDSGIEYIGQPNQQMGDGGIIVQITDTATSEVVASTSGSWTVLVIHRAPLNTECEKDADPDATCRTEITLAPADWSLPSYDDSGWADATEWTEAAVSPKDGYDQVTWDSAALLVWGSDLEVDNTVLLRTTVEAAP